MPKNSVYKQRLNSAILRLHQSGMIDKLFTELQLDIQIGRGKSSGSLLKSKTPKQLSAADVEDRGLTLADTEGMFLLMGIGYLFGAFVLVSEIVGGFSNRCRKLARRVSVATTVGSVLPNSSRRTSVRSNWNGTMMDGLETVAEIGDDSLESSSSTTSSTTSSMVQQRGRGRRMSMSDSKNSAENHGNGTSNGRRRNNSLDFNRYKGIPFIPAIYVGSEPNCTTVEINRVPTTPFEEIDLDTTFGERVYYE